MSAAGIIPCACCAPPPCTTCCYQVTFSGITYKSPPSPDNYISGYTAAIAATQGTLNAAHIVCTDGVFTDIEFAMRIDYSGATPFTDCGYAFVRISFISDHMIVELRLPAFTAANDETWLFTSDITLTAPQLAALAAVSTLGCTDAGFSATGTNDLSVGFSYPYTNGDGSVTVTLVPNCGGENPDFVVDCTTTGGFAQSICPEEDCPCGRADAQPTCLLVTIKGSDGVDSVYQNGTLISGAGGRLYTFSGPYRRDDGTWWRFIIVTDSPTTPAWNTNGAYFELQCPGDNLDSSSGTYTYSDAGDWTGTVATVLTNHQTALTNIGTTVTVAACTCEDAADLYNVSIQCEIGTNPSGWADIEVDRSTVCEWTGSDATYSVSLTYDSGAGQWTIVVTRISDSQIMFSATWTGSGSDPTGSHPYDAAFQWDEDCSELEAVIS